MDLRWLQDFLTLAESGQFTTAAELRHLSQSAFSRRIQSLETWVGTPLIDRSCFPLKLTPVGEQFRSNAAEIVRKVVDARCEAGMSTDVEVLRIAMPHSLATSKFPGLCKRWREQGGPNALRLLVGNVHDSVEWLNGGVVSMMVCIRHAAEEMQLDPLLFKRVVLESDVLRLYRPAGMPVVESDLHSSAPGQCYPFVSYPQGSYFRRLIDVATSDLLNSTALETVCETDLVDGARELVRGGIGLAWLPQSTAKNALAQREILEIDSKRWTIPMQICLYAKRCGPSSAAVDRAIAAFTRLAPTGD